MNKPDTQRETGKQAAHWLVALEEEPTNEDLHARFEAWLAADPSHLKAWKDTTETYRLLGDLPSQNLTIERSVSTAQNIHDFEVLRKAATQENAIKPARKYWAFAAMALAACIAMAFFPNLSLRLQADHITATGQIEKLTLSDGSIVYLGADSAITSDLSGHKRQVHLISGEAFFEVTKDAKREFVVLAGPSRTIVHGTAFHIRIDPASTAVQVREGLVSVEPTEASLTESAQLGEGDWATVSNALKVKHGAGPAGDADAFLKGRILARDRRLGDVVEELRRYYKGGIVFADGSLKNDRITGVYNSATPVLALQAMVAARGAKVTQISPWLLVISRS